MPISKFALGGAMSGAARGISALTEADIAREEQERGIAAKGALARFKAEQDIEMEQLKQSGQAGRLMYRLGVEAEADIELEREKSNLRKQEMSDYMGAMLEMMKGVNPGMVEGITHVDPDVLINIDRKNMEKFGLEGLDVSSPGNRGSGLAAAAMKNPEQTKAAIDLLAQHPETRRQIPWDVEFGFSTKGGLKIDFSKMNPLEAEKMRAETTNEFLDIKRKEFEQEILMEEEAKIKAGQPVSVGRLSLVAPQSVAVQDYLDTIRTPLQAVDAIMQSRDDMFKSKESLLTRIERGLTERDYAKHQRIIEEEFDNRWKAYVDTFNLTVGERLGMQWDYKMKMRRIKAGEAGEKVVAPTGQRPAATPTEKTPAEVIQEIPEKEQIEQDKEDLMRSLEQQGLFLRGKPVEDVFRPPRLEFSPGAKGSPFWFERPFQGPKGEPRRFEKESK